MAENIEGSYRLSIIEVACSFPTEGSPRAIVQYFSEGATPTQIQMVKAGGGLGETIYANIAIEFLTDYSSSSGAVISSEQVVAVVRNTTVASPAATARVTSFAKEVTIPPGTAVIGISMNAGAADYDDSELVYINLPPRSLTILKALR